MIYRHQEILQVLYEHNDGLKTDDIRIACMMNVGSEIPNDNSQVSKLIYDLKRKGYVEAIDGGISKITDAGINALSDALKDDCEQENTVTLDNTDSQSGVAIDVSGLSELQTGLLAALATQFLAANKLPVEDLQLKLSTLGKLSEFLSDDIREVIRAIANDLQRQ